MARKKKGKNSGKLRKIIIAFFALLILLGAISFYDYYKKIFGVNVKTLTDAPEFIYIPTGSQLIDVVRILDQNNLLINSASFEWLAVKMEYDQKILPGKYQVKPGMNNKELVSLLRSGKQTPVKVIFNNIRTRQEFADRISEQIEADNASLLALLNNQQFVDSLGEGFTTENVHAIFLPNTYEFYWNTNAREFVERMKKEYDKFWTPEREEKAKKLGFTKAEVSVMASIVEQETKKKDEMPRVAGVYMNRYTKGWKLEADPTLVFASGDFMIRRVLNIHKKIDSPYNTYKYTGLPPGPISIPSITAVNSVLNFEKHDYMFFCARADFSGYHAFAKTYPEHLVNARKFQKELNRRNIKS
jgi:UPF0755 protein